MATKVIFGTRLNPSASEVKSAEAPANLKTTVARPAPAQPARED